MQFTIIGHRQRSRFRLFHVIVKVNRKVNHAFLYHILMSHYFHCWVINNLYKPQPFCRQDCDNER